MIDLRSIPDLEENLNSYEVENNLHSWSYQPEKSPLRVTSADGIWFTTEDGRKRSEYFK